MKIVLSAVGAISLIIFSATYRADYAYEAEFRTYRGHLYVTKKFCREPISLLTLRDKDRYESGDIYWATFVGDRCTALKLGTPSMLIEEPSLSVEAPVRYALYLVNEARVELAKEKNRVRKQFRIVPKWLNKLRYLFASRSASSGGFSVHTAESSNSDDKGILYA